MSEQLTFISASEAAEIVGVSAQTIRNLCKAKTIRYQLKSQLFYPCKEDVERYADTITEIHETERSIEEYSQFTKKLNEQARKAAEDMRGQLEEMKMYPERIKNVTNLLISLLPHFSHCLTEQEMNVVLLVMRGDKLSDVAENVKLSRDRTRQIWEKAIHTMSCFPDELQMKDKQIADMMQIIHNLEKQLTAHGIEIEPYNQAKLLETPIDNCNFSPRTMNALWVAEIKTIGDLINFPPSELLKFRNFGKKGLQEIKEWLAEHKLAFAQYDENNAQESKDEMSSPLEQPQNKEVYTPTINTPLLERPIDYCNFSTRTHKGLIAAEIEVVGDLQQMRHIDLQNIRNFGPKSVAEVEEWMTEHNLSLKEHIPSPYVNKKHSKKRSGKQI